MNKFVFISLVFMGIAFYELSGGSDFVPRKADLIAAAQEAEKRARAVQAAQEKQSQPERASTVTLATATPLRTVSVTEKRIPTAVAQDQVTVDTTDVDGSERASITGGLLSNSSDSTSVYVSLEQSGDLFERPLTQINLEAPQPLSDQPADQTTSADRLLDIREVAGTVVNVRRGPGTGYDVVTSLRQGAAVEVIETDTTGWVKLRIIEDDRIGWMAEYLLTQPTG